MLAININMLIGFFLDFTVQFGIVVITLFLSVKLRGFITQFQLNKNLFQENSAVAVSTFGYYLSIILIIYSAIQGESYGYVFDVISIISIISIGLILLTLNRWIINAFYLRSLNSSYELEKENIAFAIFQIGGFLATSIIFYSSFAGFDFNIGLIFVGLTFFFITQITLFIVIKIFIAITSYDDIREIQKGNIAVSIEFLSLFIALSILFGNIVGQVANINFDSIAMLFIYFAISSLFLIYIPSLLTSVLISGNKRVDKSIADGNVIVAIKSAVVRVIIAIIIIETLPLNIII